MTTRAQVVAEARSWIGTPFVHQASLKGIGCDCIGLVCGVAIECGFWPADIWSTPEAKPYVGYGRCPDGRLIAGCRQYLDAIPFAEAAAGDVLALRVGDKHAQHIGIVTELDPLTMLHSYSRARVMACIEQPVGAFWHQRFVAAFRFRGIE